MTEMIEKVARAICVQQEIDPDELTRDRPEYEPYPQWWGFTPTARAAIEAMRDPTPAMQQVMAAQWGRRTWSQYGEVIDAALNTSGGEAE